MVDVPNKSRKFVKGGRNISRNHPSFPCHMGSSESLLFCIVLYLQVCLSFALHRGVVVIPKTVHPFRVVENMDATKITLDEDDLMKLQGLDCGVRLYKVSLF